MGRAVGMAFWGQAAVDQGLAPDETSGTLWFWGEADSLGLANDDPVATWTDLSAAARNYGQGTAANRPLYKTNVLNGLAGILYDGVNDTIGNLDNPDHNAVQVIAVIAHTASPTSLAYTVFNTDGITQDLYFISRHDDANGNVVAGHFAGTAKLTDDVLPTDGSAHILTWMRNPGVGGHADTDLRFYIRIDGAYQYDQANMQSGQTMSQTQIGRDAAGAKPLKGYIFGIAVWTGVFDILSDAETAEVEQYFAAKYGLTLA